MGPLPTPIQSRYQGDHLCHGTDDSEGQPSGPTEKLPDRGLFSYHQYDLVTIYTVPFLVFLFNLKLPAVQCKPTLYYIILPPFLSIVYILRLICYYMGELAARIDRTLNKE